MIGDNIFTYIIWFIQHGILAILPVDFPTLPLLTYQASLMNMSAFLTQSFGGLNNIFPVYLLLAFVIIGVSAELILFSIKGVIFVINLVRGSGA